MKVSLHASLTLLFALLFPASLLATDASSLKPPAGARVAIVMFGDLASPDCARAYPVVRQAAEAHKVPLVLHDFALPRHNWSFDAAVFARFFDTQSQKTGDDFRAYILQNQPGITPKNLPQFVQKFADKNSVPLPFNVDPEGKLAKQVKADFALGQQIGLEHTPTVFVVGAGMPSPPLVETVDGGKLAHYIEEMQKRASAAASARNSGAKKHVTRHATHHKKGSKHR